MANYTIKNLINDSIACNGMVAVYPQSNAEERIDFPNVATFNGCYASNNGTLAFVKANILYATPATTRAYEILETEGFSKKDFYVPFSNGDYPKEEKNRWENLRAMQRSFREEEFILDCNAYCDEHYIGVLDDEVLSKCLIMPKEGIKIKHPYYESVYYPAINQQFFDCTVPEKLGRFCTNNGRVVFVYRDGTTRVTRGYWILDALREAGYREAGLFVPFSNGEEILEPAYRIRWEEICSK